MSAILVAAIAALVTIMGWFATHILLSLREQRAAYLKFILEHAERQISSFYMPLRAILEELQSTAIINTRINNSSIDKKDEIRKYIDFTYFCEQHHKMMKILRENIYLIEGWDIPPSYSAYISHYTSENIAYNIEKDLGVVPTFDVTTWPSHFRKELDSDFELVSMRYEYALKELRRPFWPVNAWLVPKDPESEIRQVLVTRRLHVTSASAVLP